jgi:hypothetical protein
MNFTNYIKESALLASDDMKEYSQKVFSKILVDVLKYVTYNHFRKSVQDTEILSRDVSSKYGEYFVKTFYHIDPDFDGQASTNPETKEIFINVSQDDYKKLNENSENVKKEFRLAILHELLHLHDPKLNGELGKKIDASGKAMKGEKEIRKLFKELKEETDKDKKKEILKSIKEWTDKYFKFPWEIDAYVSSEAELVFEDIVKNSRNKKAALEYVKNYIPEGPVQKLYKEDDKVWKRFVMHLVKLIERHYT